MGVERSAWRIIPRPLLETILNNHAHHHRVAQPLVLHGPRGVGKASLLLHRLLPDWNNHSPHFTAYVDFAHANTTTTTTTTTPWASWSSAAPPAALSSLRSHLEAELESVVLHGVRLGSIGGNDVFAALNRRHGIHAALRRVAGSGSGGKRESLSVLWARAVVAMSGRVGVGEIDKVAGNAGGGAIEEVSYMREAAVSLRLAKEVIGIHQEWRRDAIRRFNRNGGFSRSLANSCTDWPCLLVELLSAAAEIDYFQPKLVINNFDMLRNAILTDDSMVSAALYHDSFLWRLIALGVNDWCLPVVLVTSDSYYSYQVYEDFGYPDVFISRETFGWTPQEAKMHMVPEIFSETEWKAINEVLGPNQRQLNELYALKQLKNYQGSMHASDHFEDIVDTYLAYLQVNVVNPAMESVMVILQKFVSDAKDGKFSESRFHFGAPWRHPPCTSDHELSLQWAKIQLMDFVQSLVNTEFGVNYLADDSLEILEDPCTVAMLEVGLLYAQRDPSYIRPVSRGILRCLVRWLVHERMQMTIWETIPYLWQRIIRGRSYRHLMKEIGYK